MSKDKRIDLTQFEEHLKMWPEPWTITEDMQLIVPANHENPNEMRCRMGSSTTTRIMAMAPDLIAELKRCYEELDRPKVTIDDWDKAGPCVTVYLEGKEYVGILREYNASE